MARFRDITGRPGPATWQGGTYQDGYGDYPVTGVSWYEASAYAEFVGKSLPSAYHWSTAAAGPTANIGRSIMSQSNFSDGLAPVGTYGGLSLNGAYDMAGNAREWVWNEVGGSTERYLLGGSWADPEHSFQQADVRDPFDRSNLNGFRCGRLGDPGLITDALLPIHRLERDFMAEEVATDEVFEVYASSFGYDRGDLDDVVEATDESSQHWVRERVVINTPYGDERFAVYVFLPTNVEPPYQTVVVFPNGGAVRRQPFDDWPTDGFDYIVMSGRAVALPILDERLSDTVDGRPSHMDRRHTATGPFAPCRSS